VSTTYPVHIFLLNVIALTHTIIIHLPVVCPVRPALSLDGCFETVRLIQFVPN
jgi:hypothetical protein